MTPFLSNSPNQKFGPSVPRASFHVVVGVDRLAFAVAFKTQSVGGNLVLDQEFIHGFGAIFRKRLVAGVVTHVVGVAVDLDAQGRHFVEQGDQIVELGR